MKVTIVQIKKLTRSLAEMKLKKYSSLSEAKNDFDLINLELVNLDSDDQELIQIQEIASNYFNLLNKEDFETNDKQQINEAKSVISRYCITLNSVLVKWKTELGFQ